MHIYIIMQAVQFPINIQAACAFMQLYKNLCNLFRICLQKVYKKYIESARGGWYNRGRKKKKGGATMTDRQTQKLLRALLAIVKRCATVEEVSEVLEQMLQD